MPNQNQNQFNNRETDLSRNLGVGLNLDSSAGFTNHRNNRTSPISNNRNGNGKYN